MEPDHLIAIVEQRQYGKKLPGMEQEKYEWARTAHSKWLAAGNSDYLALISIAEIALLTRGKLLRSKFLEPLLAQGDLTALRKHLREFEADIDERTTNLESVSP
jgi:hypothetical protein